MAQPLSGGAVADVLWRLYRVNEIVPERLTPRKRKTGVRGVVTRRAPRLWGGYQPASLPEPAELPPLLEAELPPLLEAELPPLLEAELPPLLEAELPPLLEAE
ncbi:hypothetical protein ABGB19_21655, partial [Mycobacterium sp. B14F4]|uniref:hypothetical protein n=1 Tax=Mycobacterium sp. B14F4 TaxID=3153565 RepID=UPI00325E0539